MILLSAARSVVLFLGFTAVLSCSGDIPSKNNPSAASEKPASPANVFSVNIIFSVSACNGFSFPFGDGTGGGNYKGYNETKTYKGWYIATKTGEKYSLGIHTGEDWNGNGGGDTEFGQPVYATASGEVIEAKDFGAPWGNVVYIRHVFFDNARIDTVYSLYAHLNELKITKGSLVNRRQNIGTIGTGHKSFPAHLHFEIRKASMAGFETTYWPSSHERSQEWVLAHYEKPSAFIKAHQKLLLPAKEDLVLVAVKHEYKMYLYKKGTAFKTYDIALSQSPLGHKQQEGDNRLPEGEYKIIQKTEGPFAGAYSQYLGPRFMRLNYPNNTDAVNAFEAGKITKTQRDQIVQANNQNKEPDKHTGLGGGIGIHGWAGNWPSDNRHLTWGCISMQNPNLLTFYDEVPLYTRILIYP
ncbi:MAG: peptidoglycan DD-metalloendopeptidase family protein [Bacteroidetes bacterium]|nr:peptidoglycan DD-metalloendopeptidase family protein [Bacteroidota bacterium]